MTGSAPNPATFGVIVSRNQIEAAVLSLLSSPPPASGSSYPLVAYYLAEIERQSGLAAKTFPLPPGPSSYRGGADAMTMLAEWFPMYSVVVQSQSTEYLDRFNLAATYKLQVTATVADDSEDTARLYADGLGAAAAKALMDFGSLGGIASSTMLTDAPDIAFLDARDARQVARSTVTAMVSVMPVLQLATPQTWGADPYVDPTAWPTVQTVSTTVTAQQ